MQKFKVGDLILVLNAWDARAVGTVTKIVEHCFIIDDPYPYKVKIEGSTRAHTWADGIVATELLKALT